MLYIPWYMQMIYAVYSTYIYIYDMTIYMEYFHTVTYALCILDSIGKTFHGGQGIYNWSQRVKQCKFIQSLHQKT